jgi:hypothetical protein
MAVFSRTVTVKLERAHADKISRIATKRAVPQSEVIREAIEGLVEEETSGLEAVADLVGAIAGPRDLSTNPKHLEGLGRDRPRHRTHSRAS